MRQRSLSAGWRVVACMDHRAEDIVACAPLARSLSMHPSFSGRRKRKCSRANVCNSTRLHKVEANVGEYGGAHHVSAHRRWVTRLSELGGLREVSGLSKLTSRIGRPLHLTVSWFWPSGVSPLPHTHTRRGMFDGAYRHRASQRELRDCGDSGFILGGLDCESRL